MQRRTIGRGLVVALLVGAFGAGFLCGSVSQHRAEAQVRELEGQLMKEAGESGGMLGSVAQLGSSIVERQDHINGLQKNMDTLKKV